MKFLDIGNIVLTKGESSDTFEITSDTSLGDYKGKLRISDPSGIKHQEDLKHSKEEKNDDNIFNDDLIITYVAERFSFAGSIQDETTQDDTPFVYQIRIDDIQKDELNEEATVTGKVFRTETQDTIDPDAGTQGGATDPDAGTQNPDAGTQGSGGQLGPDAIVSQVVEIGIEGAKVTVDLTSESKEVTRQGTAVSNKDGEFTMKIFLGQTVKTPAKQALLFQISSSVTEKLDAGRYYCTVTILKEELDQSISFQKEVLQTKLDINEKN